MRSLIAAGMLACTPSIPYSTTRPDPVSTDSGSSSDGNIVDSESFDVLVEVHPEVRCVLQIYWTRGMEADQTWIEFSVDEEEWLSTPAQEAFIGEHSEVLLGAPCESELSYRFVTKEGDETRTEDELSAWTGAAPWTFPESELLTWEPELATSERWVLGSLDVDQSGWYGGPFTVFIVDRKGRLVWYYEVPDSRLSLQAQVSWDGTHVVLEGSTNYVWSGDPAPSVTTLTLDYAVLEAREIPDLGLTLDEIEDGTILYEKNTTSRSLMELSTDGTEREIWNCDDWMLDAGASTHNCAPNTIIWVPETDTVLWSMYNNDTVVELDRASGEVIRQWGQMDGSWDVDPLEAMIDYQHYPNYTPEGTLLVSTHIRGNSSRQMAREFHVDDETQTLTEIWSYGQASPYYATYAGEATRVGENTLISYGTDGALVEVTPDGEVAWELRWMTGTHPHLLGHLTLIDDLYALNEGPDGR